MFIVDGTAFTRRQPHGLPHAVQARDCQLRGVLGTDQQYVYPGKFVHELRNWEWKPVFEDWAEYDEHGRHGVILAALRKFTSGVFVANVIPNVQL